MKYLFVGDIHNKDYIFKDVYKLDKEYNFDRIIFMGDYVDDWNTDNHKSLETLNTVISMKKGLKDKVILLLGNHELSYLGFKCSGHCYELDDIMEIKLKEYIDLFDFYTSVQCNDKEYICTHAGITNGFILGIIGENWKQELNKWNKNKLQYLDLLSISGYYRGGTSAFGSFVWADIREHIVEQGDDLIIPYQIIGHTPVRSIEQVQDKYFIDTHSTYNNGEHIGDKSYLIWNEDRFEIVF